MSPTRSLSQCESFSKFLIYAQTIKLEYYVRDVSIKQMKLLEYSKHDITHFSGIYLNMQGLLEEKLFRTSVCGHRYTRKWQGIMLPKNWHGNFSSTSNISKVRSYQHPHWESERVSDGAGHLVNGDSGWRRQHMLLWQSEVLAHHLLLTCPPFVACASVVIIFPGIVYFLFEKSLSLLGMCFYIQIYWKFFIILISINFYTYMENNHKIIS